MKVEVDPYSGPERRASLDAEFSDPSSCGASADLSDSDPAFGDSVAPFLLSESAVPTAVETELLEPARIGSTSTPSWSRALDVTVASVLLILLSPLFLVTIVLVRLSGPGPIIYRHRRIGQGGAEFPCLKFRTMISGADSMITPLVDASEEFRSEWLAGQKILNDPRVTRVGRTLRRYSIDELPQLLNVLSGEMSMVGPRPIVRDEIHRYGANYIDYCTVKPGLTGLWQVSGRNALSYDMRVELDSAYARSKCLRMDLVILLRTVPVVLLGKGC